MRIGDLGKSVTKLWMAVLLTFIAALTTMACAADGAAPKPKYVFLMIGDGMGVPQRMSADLYKNIEAGGQPGEAAGVLLMNRFPVKGLTTTHPIGAPITDSAAAATALACGEKTKNGRLSIDANGQTKFKSIAYTAKEAGMKVGIVSSVPIDHATPAAFYACENSRGNYYEIAAQAASSGFNYFAGQYFLGGKPDKCKGRPSPIEIARQAGYTTYCDREGLEKITPGDDKIVWEAEIPFVVQQDADHVTLADLTRKGIEVLDNDRGFFMMVEGGKIDWAGHANDLASNIKETLDFDAAIRIVYDFYQAHPEETLIVVTGDHECGGMKTAFRGGFSRDRFMAAVKAQKVSGKEFATQVETWKKQGTLKENVLKHIAEDFGITDLSPAERDDLEKVIAFAQKDDSVDTRPEELKKMYGGKNMIFNACQTIIARRCGVTWTSFNHTGAPVATSAIGVGAESFGGQTDNTDIANKLRALLP